MEYALFEGSAEVDTVCWLNTIPSMSKDYEMIYLPKLPLMLYNSMFYSKVMRPEIPLIEQQRPYSPATAITPI